MRASPAGPQARFTVRPGGSSGLYKKDASPHAGSVIAERRRSSMADDIAPGLFISPDRELEALADPNERTGVPVYSGYQALQHAAPFLGRNRFFDTLVEKVSALRLPYEDQCSAKYYYDLVAALHDEGGEFERVVEVGCYMGGSASIIAGCAERLDFDFDIVDIDRGALLFAYERIRRVFPDAARRIRLFHGTLPQYVAAAMEGHSDGRLLVHHDGSHEFAQVVRDLSSLSFVRDRLHAIIIQDTHLRGEISFCQFVDLAVYAVFGTEVAYRAIGSAYDATQTEMMTPNRYQGNYFLPDAPEGIIIPMSANRFEYPHPMLTLQSFL